MRPSFPERSRKYRRYLRRSSTLGGGDKWSRQLSNVGGTLTRQASDAGTAVVMGVKSVGSVVAGGVSGAASALSGTVVPGASPAPVVVFLLRARHAAHLTPRVSGSVRAIAGNTATTEVTVTALNEPTSPVYRGLEATFGVIRSIPLIVRDFAPYVKVSKEINTLNAACHIKTGPFLGSGCLVDAQLLGLPEYCIMTNHHVMFPRDGEPPPPRTPRTRADAAKFRACNLQIQL